MANKAVSSLPNYEESARHCIFLGSYKLVSQWEMCRYNVGGYFMAVNWQFGKSFSFFVIVWSN